MDEKLNFHYLDMYISSSKKLNYFILLLNLEGLSINCACNYTNIQTHCPIDKFNKAELPHMLFNIRSKAEKVRDVRV
jgi:hypothetical protein